MLSAGKVLHEYTMCTDPEPYDVEYTKPCQGHSKYMYIIHYLLIIRLYLFVKSLI